MSSPELWQPRASAANGDGEPPAKNQEKDKGFGKSHGYSPGHGGPSGPGDAPANPSAPHPKAPKDPSEDPNVDEPLP